MRTLIVLVVLVAMGLGLAGCGPKDAHDQFLNRNMRLAHKADAKSLLDDIQHDITYDARPSHLSFFNQE